jgi:hypothetical protein
MGDAHYLPQPALSEVPGRGGAMACDDKGVTFKWKDYRIEGSPQALE